AHELRLGGRRELVVHAAQGAGRMVVREVRLHDGGLQTVLRELLGAVGAREEAAVVLAPLQLDDVGPWEARIPEDHAPASSASTGMGGWPAAAAPSPNVRASTQ